MIAAQATARPGKLVMLHSTMIGTWGCNQNVLTSILLFVMRFQLTMALCIAARSPTNVVSKPLKRSNSERGCAWPGRAAATALMVSVLGSIGACSLWPSLENKLRRDLQLMASGGDAKETEAVGTADWICFNQANNQFLYRREFLSESKRLGDAFTQSLEGCGIENSCCGADSHFSGAIGLVKSGKIRCVEVDSFDFYLKPDRPFCAKPERLMVSSKIAVPGEQPSGRQWVARAGRISFEVWEKSGK